MVTAPAGDVAFMAMQFAREAHRRQRRRYTGNPYADHLAEVAGIVATVAPPSHIDVMVAVAWLHDCIEDQGVPAEEIRRRFGDEVAEGVLMLSDLETGNRETRKAASRSRLAAASGWIQTIKVADLISNTGSIVEHDPDFARVYLREKRQLLAVLTEADPRLLDLAWQLASEQANRRDPLPSGPVASGPVASGPVGPGPIAPGPAASGRP